jgi:hypothetical protein
MLFKLCEKERVFVLLKSSSENMTFFVTGGPVGGYSTWFPNNSFVGSELEHRTM